MSNKPVFNTGAIPLTAKQRRAVVLLAKGSTATQVAQEVGVTKGTVYNWKSQNDEFRNQLESAQRQIFEEGIRQLKCLVSDAATSLRSVLFNPAAADRDKISAARTVLQFTDLSSLADSPLRDNQGGPDEFLKRMGLE